MRPFLKILPSSASHPYNRKDIHMNMSKLLPGSLLVIVISSISYGQLSKQDSIWLPFRSFIGSWEGKGGGEPGTGDYTRTYQFVLDKKYIEVRNKSIYAPSAANPEGEVHEDWGYIGYNKSSHRFMLRQFHIEGFVNEYTQDSISGDGKRIVFLSYAIENIPAGWRAKETYDVLGPDQIQETFELAEPGKEFSVYSKVILNRVK